MWKQKNVMEVLILTFIVFIIAANKCQGGSEESGGESGGSGDSGSQKITVFNRKVEISDQLAAMAKEYTEETGVEVEVLGTTGDDYLQQLQIRLNSNQGPSIFTLQNETE